MTDQVNHDALLEFAAGSTAFTTLTTLSLASLVALMSGDQARIDDAREAVIFALRRFVEETNVAIASKTERIESETASFLAWAAEFGPRQGVGLGELAAQSDLAALRTMVEKMRGVVTIVETLAGPELTAATDGARPSGRRGESLVLVLSDKTGEARTDEDLDRMIEDIQAVAERYGFKWSQRGTLSATRQQFAEWQAHLDRGDLAEMLAEYRGRREAGNHE